MKAFTIFPTLGRRTDVSPDSHRCFVYPNPENPGLAYTHDVGGINYSLQRESGSASKSLGKSIWSSQGQSGQCNGMFELYDGTNRYFFVGKGESSGYIMVYATNGTRTVITSPATFGGGEDVSFVRIGEYAAFTDQATNTPYKWKSGDGATASKLIQSGTEYKFRYLVKFQRRVFGLYSDQTDGDIDVRYSTAWPDTAITSLNYPAANQLWIPNDDPITGGGTMGINRMYIYCEDSTQQVTYYPDYDAPFRIYTVAPQQGFVSHKSIINLGDSHFGFNKNYGFCGYRGGDVFLPISQDIEPDIANIDSTYYNRIVGTFLPVERMLVWAVPLNGEFNNSHLMFYHLDSKQWSIDNKRTSWIDTWQTPTNFTWTHLSNIHTRWEDAPYGTTWQDFISTKKRLMMAGDHISPRYDTLSPAESIGIFTSLTDDVMLGDSRAPIESYRIEPIVSFGNPRRHDYLSEIWFGITKEHASTIDVYHRSGDTAGEVQAASWASIGTISCDSPDRPVVHVGQNARLHQIKWGTNGAGETFRVNRITFKYEEGSNG